MFDRIINIAILVAVVAMIALQAVTFLNTNNTAGAATHQIEADQMCMALWKDSRGFWANDQYYCEAVFVGNGMGGTSIVTYDELEEIIAKRK